MNYPFFDSSLLSTILSWLFAIPTIAYFLLAWIPLLTEKNKDYPPRLYLTWLVICVFIFSPFRYIIFQVVTATSYPVQSFGAFFSTLWLSLYVPLVFGLLYLLTSIVPTLSLLLLSPKQGQGIGLVKGLAWILIFPFACMLSSLIFFTALPSTSKTLGPSSARDIIKATNGPAAVVFKYLVKPFGPISLPEFFELTPKTDKDMIRCHVANTYLSKIGFGFFVAKQYPDIYNSIEK
jgi:hypothetical protein